MKEADIATFAGNTAIEIKATRARMGDYTSQEGQFLKRWDDFCIFFSGLSNHGQRSSLRSSPDSSGAYRCKGTVLFHSIACVGRYVPLQKFIRVLLPWRDNEF